MVSILDLPEEVIGCTLEYVAKCRCDLVKFAITCRQAHAFAVRFLLRSVVLRKDSDVRNLRSLINRDNSLRSLVLHLTIAPFRNMRKNLFQGVGELVSLLTNLQTLNVNVAERIYDGPFLVDEAQRKLFRAEFNCVVPLLQQKNCASIPNWSFQITSCYLNLRHTDDEPHMSTGILAVVAAPRLQHLTIVDADLRQFSSAWFNIHRHSSPLETLELLSCFCDKRSMSDFLSIPRALRKCSFAPLPTNSRAPFEEPMQFAELRCLLIPLATYHSQTLTDLMLEMSYDEQILGDKDYASRLELSSFQHLSRLEIRFPGGLWNHDLHTIFYYLPSSLSYFRFTEIHQTEITRSLLDVPEALSADPTLATSLHCLEMEFGCAAFPSRIRERLDSAGAVLMATRGINLRIYRRINPGGLLPPYPYGYPVPETVLVSDNNSIESLWDCKGRLETRAEEKREMIDPLCLDELFRL